MDPNLDRNRDRAGSDDVVLSPESDCEDGPRSDNARRSQTSGGQ